MNLKSIVLMGALTVGADSVQNDVMSEADLAQNTTAEMEVGGDFANDQEVGVAANDQTEVHEATAAEIQACRAKIAEVRVAQERLAPAVKWQKVGSDILNGDLATERAAMQNMHATCDSKLNLPGDVAASVMLKDWVSVEIRRKLGAN